MFMRIQKCDQCTPSPFSQLSDLIMCYETHHIHCSHSFPSIHNSAGEHSWIECKQLLNIMEWIQSQKVRELDQPNINHIKELTKDHIKGKQVKKNEAVLYSSSTSCYSSYPGQFVTSKRHRKREVIHVGKNLYQCCAVVTCEGCMPDSIIHYPTVPAAQLSMPNDYEIAPATS